MSTWSGADLRSVFFLRDGVRDGSEQSWYPSGELRSVGAWRRGLQDGPWITFHRNGARAMEQDYLRGYSESNDRRWDEHGALVSDESDFSEVMTMLLGDPDDRRAAHARFRAELTALLSRLTDP